MSRNLFRPLWTFAFLCGVGLCLVTSSVAHAQDYVPGELIVKLKGRASGVSSLAFIGKATSQKSMHLRGSWSGLNMHHFSLAANQNMAQTISELKDDPAVEYVEPNYYVSAQSLGIEGQTMSLSEVQALGDVSAMGAYSQSSSPIQVDQAWTSMTASTTNVPVIAVIDTGVDLNHSVFTSTGAIWTNPNEIASNGVDDDNNGYIDDVNGWNFAYRTNNPQDDDGHGTHVAGIILGITQDIRATTLTAAKIRIMPLKFLNSSGSGTTSDAVQAIYYAVNNGAKVLNNSWGGGGYSQSLLDAVSYTYAQNRLFVAAAGNSSSNNDSKATYPANYGTPGMIAVAATTDWDSFASFSNYGTQTVNLSGPGVTILSTLPGSTFGYSSGTSMAAPMVSGVAALVAREKPTLTPYQMRSLIYSGLNSLSILGSKVSTSGRLNANNAVVAAKAASVDTSQPAWSSSMYRAPSSSSSASDSAGVAPGGCGLVKILSESGRGGEPPAAMRNTTFFAVLLILLAPVLLGVALRSRSKGRDKRRFERYQIESRVSLKVGDRELLGSISSISLGGVQVNTDAWLENGGIVTMNIASPDGKESIQVQGKVVWSEEHKHYGVQFADAQRSVLDKITDWTRGLIRAA